MIFISPKEVAESLGVSVATVYELCVARKLGHMRIGSGRGVISIRLQVLVEYLLGSFCSRNGRRKLAGIGLTHWE